MEFLKENVYMLLWSFIGLWAFYFYLHNRRRIGAFLLGSSTGLGSLLLLHLFGGAVGYAPTLSLTNIALCTILGVPGSVLLVLSELLLG